MRPGALYGRDDVVRSLTRALRDPGALVTLTGLPGSGRTAVARVAAAQVDAAQVDGDLVARVEGRLATLPGALAAALEASTAATLVLIDDVNHAPGSRVQVRDLQRIHPQLRLLLTASTPLGLPGEVVFRLPPLPVPDPTDDPATLRTHPAVRLFADVSGRTGTTAVLDDASITAAARICEVLGGLPLAIRLVAARTATYSPTTLAALLARGPMQMLRSRGGRADEDGEHDLVEAVAWSISLLRPAERELLHDLTAFRGPVAMEVLDEVCGRPGLVDELSALVDVHLVDPLHEGPNSRFTLPPLVREHLDTTDGAEPAAVVRERHRRWALGVAAQAVSLESAGRLEQSRRLVVPHEPDLTAALGAALTLREAGAARTLALAILPLAFSRGTTPEVCRAADAVLALVHSSGQDGHGLLQGPERAGSSDQLTLAAWRELLRADTAESAAEVITSVPVLDALREQARRVDERTLLRVTYVAVQAARSLIRREVAEEWAAEGRDLATRLGDPARQVRFETWTGMMAHQRGAHAEAAAWANRALARARTLDDPSLALAPAGLLRGLPPEEAERHTSDLPTPDQLVRHARELGDLRALDWLQPTAAFADLRAGNLEAACSHSAAALRRSRATGARLRAGPALLCLFMVALRRGDVRWAGRLQGIVGRYVDVLRPGLPPAAAAAYDLSVEGYRTAAAAHPDAASDVIWGVQLSWDEGVDAALTFAAGALPTHGAEPETHRHGPWPDAPSSPRAAEHRPPSRPNGRRAPPRGPAEHATLTLREQDVLEHLVSGGTNREISLQLGISAKTVMHHTSSIYRKLGVRGRAEAVAWSLRSAPQEEPPGARLRLVEPDV